MVQKAQQQGMKTIQKTNPMLNVGMKVGMKAAPIMQEGMQKAAPIMQEGMQKAKQQALQRKGQMSTMLNEAANRSQRGVAQANIQFGSPAAIATGNPTMKK